MSTRIPRKLDFAEVRVLGSLLEKEQTNPETVPMTVNALIAACNQKTNREPVMQLTETEVVEALDRLRAEVLVWRTEGARTERWQQSVVRRWGLDRAGKALMTLLLLRGPQTPGELRTRSEAPASLRFARGGRGGPAPPGRHRRAPRHGAAPAPRPEGDPMDAPGR